MNLSERTRRYDIDWLRVIAIGFLLIYHTAIVFQPWAVFIGFIQSDVSLDGLWTGMSVLNIWRIPLLFFVSGMGVYFSLRKRTWRHLIRERFMRIALPYIFGVLLIVPVHVFLWQWYYQQDLNYMIHGGHLWFLANIFIYVIILSPFFFLIKNKDGGAFRLLHRLFCSRWGLLLPPVFFVSEAWVLKPELFELYAMTWHGFVLGLIAFFFGYMFMLGDTALWENLKSLRFMSLGFAIAGYSLRIIYFNLEAPLALKAIESIAWIYSLFGFGYMYLQRPGPWLDYLSRAAYPVYIVHMMFLYLGSVLVLPLPLPAVIKFLAVTVITFGGSLGCYEFIIRRIRLFHIPFGIRQYARPEKQKVAGRFGLKLSTGSIK